MKLEFLTGNWGLKILAVILATVLYYAVKQSLVSDGSTSSANRHERTEQQTH